MSRGPKPYYSREPRSDLKVPATVFFDGVSRAALLTNVSLSGGLFELVDGPGLRMVVAVSICPMVGDPIYSQAIVMRVDKLGEGREACAVQFVNLPPESEGRLAYLIKKKAIPRPQR